MCRRNELSETIGIAAERGCDPSNAVRLLKNATRQISESGSELSDADKAALFAARDSAKEAAVANYQQLLAGI